jgi:putative flippase GtrA
MYSFMLRFVIVGAANTVWTGLLILAIAHWLDIAVAYTIAFVCGLIFTTMSSGVFVFRSRLTPRAVRRFVSWYLCVYLVGVTMAHLAGDQWHVSHLLATAAVLAVTAPLNFLGGVRAFLSPTTD